MVKTTMVYETDWIGRGLFCPLGNEIFAPTVRIEVTDSTTIPYEEIDDMIEEFCHGTYESAAEFLAETIKKRYCADYVKVTVGKLPFFVVAEC